MQVYAILLTEGQILIHLFIQITLIVRSIGLAGYSKDLDSKLVGMQVICRTNIQTAPGGIYGISPGATLAMW